MKQLVQSYKTGEVALIDVPVGAPGPNEVQIATRSSLISAGTERMLVSFGRSNVLQKAKSQPDKVRQVIDKVRTEGLLDTYDAVTAKLDQPVPLGYSNVGVVRAVGSDVQGFAPGDRVVSNGRHAEVVNVGANLVDLIPDEVSDELATYAVVGSIGLQGIRLLKPEFGENILVYGAGLIGLLAIQMLLRSGCRVVAVDIDASNLEVAKMYGAEIIKLTPTNDIDSQLRAIKLNGKIDAALITAAAKNDSIVKNCCSALRKRGRIVLTGVVDLNFDRSWLYEKEISFQVSCSYGPGRYEENYEGRGLDYPIAFVRWTEQRNFTAVLSAMSKGWIHTDFISSTTFRFVDSAAAYDLLTKKGKERPPMAIQLTYDQETTSESCVRMTNRNDHPVEADAKSISVIGAGNYAMRRMLPGLIMHGSKIKHIVSKGGLSSSIAAIKYGASYSTVEIADVVQATDVSGVCIATRHNSHADLTIKMVKAGKMVFVEKPLAINKSQLERLQALNEEEKRHIFVGFNREYSKYSEILKKNFHDDKSPKLITLEMNAGKIPADHWTQDMEIGGGRLIGEAVHYISLAQFIANSKVSSIHIESLDADPEASDSFCLILNFENGDLANILYYSDGSSRYRKESVKCIAGGKVFEIDNFKGIYGVGPGLLVRKRTFRQEKGQNECFANFAKHVADGNLNSPEVVERFFEATKISVLATEILINQGRGSSEVR